ncbi:hypothetical protein [Gluconobacter aidae]|uniref:Uncharacterized protein n=1 Tax=Gluconobacter aidae TaxID=2662454 RepID=A0A7X1SRB5_9PROT|nr:hypothetical protein [Gluconobacter aidae]MQR99322.1 hypothetical protein [Gluconobacter aidae]
MAKRTDNRPPWCVKDAESAVDELIFLHRSRWETERTLASHAGWSEEQKTFRDYMARVFSEIDRIRQLYDRETADQFAADIGKQWKIFMAAFG